MREPSLHHIGHVVSSIDGFIGPWRSALGAVGQSEIFHDPIQRVRVAFLDLPEHGGVLFELVEPVGPDSPVYAFAKKGGGMHHLCFEVDNLEHHIERMKRLKAMLIGAPQPAIAFAGRRIAWMYLREKLLVEYLERSPD
jgi:methylmalonyl-CoA/ethylmalonyl-CoA epimerase